MKALVRNLIRKLGYDISRKTPGLVDFLQHHGVTTVIDVGANEGQFGLWLRDRGYTGRIISFEPVSEPFATLKTRTSSDANWQVHHLALGAESGQTAINVSEYTEFSSLNEITAAATRFDTRSATVRQEQIKVSKFDDLNLEDLPHSLLKIDTQGYEKQVLAGARESLSKLRAVQLELPVVHFYENSWRIADAFEFMRKFGFVLAQIRPVNFSSQDPVSVVEVDALFRRYDKDIDA